MSEVIKPIVAFIGIILALSSIPFYLAITSGVIRAYQGDPNATQGIINATTDEAVSTLELDAGTALAIAICSALGLGAFVAILKKL